MTNKICRLTEIQKSSEYQIFIRGCADKAVQGMLTLLITVNIGAFFTVIELLKGSFWLIGFFSLSVVCAFLARAFLFYLYRLEVNLFEDSELSDEDCNKLQRKYALLWNLTERFAWGSMSFIIIGVLALMFVYIQS